MNNASSETGNDLDLDFQQEIKNNNYYHNKSINYNYAKMEDEIKIKNTKISNHIFETPIGLFENDIYDENKYNYNNILSSKDYLVNNLAVNIKNYRLDNFKSLRNKFEKISLSTQNKKSLKLDKIFLNSYKEKDLVVVNQINSLLLNIDSMKTKQSFSPDIKDSLLNSYKNFIILKEHKKFKEGVSILDLKKEQFLKKTNLLDKIKEQDERMQKRNISFERQMLLNEYKILNGIDNNIFSPNKFKKEKILENKYKNFYSEIKDENDNEKKENFFSTGLNTKKIKINRNMKKNFNVNIELDINKIFDDKNQNIISTLNDERNLRKKFALPKINMKEVNIDLIPEKFDIYSKVKIKDLIGLGHLIKPKFRYK